jgi:hypothetical protein
VYFRRGEAWWIVRCAKLKVDAGVCSREDVELSCHATTSSSRLRRAMLSQSGRSSAMNGNDELVQTKELKYH